MDHHFLMVSFVSFLMEMMCLFSGATGTSKTPKGTCIVELFEKQPGTFGRELSSQVDR